MHRTGAGLWEDVEESRELGGHEEEEKEKEKEEGEGGGGRGGGNIKPKGKTKGTGDARPSGLNFWRGYQYEN